jgi:hypothetical protein
MKQTLSKGFLAKKTSLFHVIILLAQLTAFGQDASAPQKISLWAKHAPIGGGCPRQSER